MTAISWLNPCPLNACCDIWGQCGITEQFCNNTSLGPPGTAATGSDGCISNCGTDIVQGGAPASFISLTYYEGFSLGTRSCLFQDIRQVDTTQYSHIHYSFGVLDPSNYSVSVGDMYSQYEFEAFKELSNVHRVLTIGGWAFSTDSSTYNIFREGVTSANRMTMAQSIANFVTSNNLDGIDIDWEYPGVSHSLTRR
jgi:GH18 family chitinase